MKIQSVKIPGVLLIEPDLYQDDRGFFYESFNKETFLMCTGLDISFVQDNHCMSIKGALRGLHYQLAPFAQSKLFRVLKGEVMDVVVDIRRSSPTYGHHLSFILSAENRTQIWIPEGCAHGFVSLSESSECLYKVTKAYRPSLERCIVWNDMDLNINWPRSINIKVSKKDALGQTFLDAEKFL